MNGCFEKALNYLPVVGVFAAIILVSNYFLFSTSKSELAPQEDQGIVIGLDDSSPRRHAGANQLYSSEGVDIFA